MPSERMFSAIRLVNGSVGDPVLYLDYPGRDNALLFDAGDNGALSMQELADLEAVFVTHHHIDHWIGLDRILRANLDRDKTIRIFGPAGTIDRTRARIGSYEHSFFPFQKLCIELHELSPGKRKLATLECTKKFAEPEVVETAWKGPVAFETPDMTVEAVAVDHTVPCLAYAVVERKGYHPDAAKLDTGLLRPGPWVGEVLDRLRNDEPLTTKVKLKVGTFTLEELVEHGFSWSNGKRTAFVTDTQWSDDVRDSLVKLASRSWRLYCDSYYASADAKQAAKYRHMTATAAGELAKAAKVDELVLMHFAPRYAGRYQMLVDEAKQVFPRVTAIC
ncbi:MAG: MBL fold metallo-hydrolase [Gemmataceae bacterium]